MNITKLYGRACKTALVILALIALAGGSGLATALKATAPQDAVTLVYKFTKDVPLSYKQMSTQIQNVDVMGQMMTTDVTGSMDITLLPKGLKDGNHLLGVTINAMVMNVSGPQGNITPDVSNAVGKSFDFVLSPRGEDVDVSGAAAFTIDLGQGGRRDLTSSFQGLFAKLPDHPVKAGDKWPSEDNIVQKSDAGDIRIVFKNENTLDGFETIDGRECVRIKTAVHGTMSGALNQGGMSMTMDGKIEGTETSYFDFKNGVFVKSDMTGDMNGGINAEAMGMTIGFTGTQRNSMALVKK